MQIWEKIQIEKNH